MNEEKELTIEEKAVAILKRIHAICNEDNPKDPDRTKLVTFEQDWDGYSLTICIDGAHTHVGYPGCDDFGVLVDNLYNTLHGGPGLSWVGE